MRCPQCHHGATRVIDSRPAEHNAAIRRRRVCEACDHRFSTFERVVPVVLVTKRDGRVEVFSAEKLRRGVVAALADRPVPAGAVELLIDEIEGAARARVSGLTSEEIGAMVLSRLRELDEIASLRFASVYKDFSQVEDFERELAELEASVNTPEA
jgi:transcriptional repressor NrdR